RRSNRFRLNIAATVVCSKLKCLWWCTTPSRRPPRRSTRATWISPAGGLLQPDLEFQSSRPAENSVEWESEQPDYLGQSVEVALFILWEMSRRMDDRR